MDALRASSLARVSALALLALMALACGGGEPAAPPPPPPPPPPLEPAPPTTVQVSPLRRATVQMALVDGAKAVGTLRLLERANGPGVAIDYRLESLPPGSYVAVLHAGDCTAPGAAAMRSDGEAALFMTVANVKGRARGKLVVETLDLETLDLEEEARVVVMHKGDATGQQAACGSVTLDPS